jgi:hypothetical protein
LVGFLELSTSRNGNMILKEMINIRIKKFTKIISMIRKERVCYYKFVIYRLDLEASRALLPFLLLPVAFLPPLKFPFGL